MGKTLNRHDLFTRLVACGVSRTLSSQLVEKFLFWRQEGRADEWTVEHLKALKVDLIRHMAGLPPISPWIRRRSDKITPVGPFGGLWKIAKSRPFTALNAIMIYSSLIYESRDPIITPKQLKGFLEAVNRAPVTTEAELLFSQLMSEDPFELSGRNPIMFKEPFSDVGPSLLEQPIKPYKRSPIPYKGLVPKESVLPAALSILMLWPHFGRTYQDMVVQSLGPLTPLLTTMDHRSVLPPEESIDVFKNNELTMPYGVSSCDRLTSDARHQKAPSYTMCAGRVAFIQDSGYKLRHIFIANELVQSMALPLKDYLMNQIRGLQYDCTYDQDSGVDYIQSCLKAGNTAHCFDLSKCSDNLPRRFQLEIFKQAGLPQETISFFKDVCDSGWEIDTHLLPDEYPDGTPNPLKKCSISPFGECTHLFMTVGQPLGFGPSFASFSILHHAIILAIFKRLKRKPRYRILGDDIVILDDQAAAMYQHTMSVFGVPISSTKTIVSNRLAEFAGRLIFPDRIVIGYKWKGRCSDNSFLDLAKNLGPKSLKLLRPRQRFVAEILGWIPEPWGLGWNPEGRSYVDRIVDPVIDELIDLLLKKDVRKRHFQRRTSRLNHIVYGHPEYTNFRYVGNLLDQSSLGQTHLRPGLLEFFSGDEELLMPNLDYLARYTDVRWPDFDSLNSFLSKYSWIEKMKDLRTLNIYERKLGLASNKE